MASNAQDHHAPLKIEGKKDKLEETLWILQEVCSNLSQILKNGNYTLWAPLQIRKLLQVFREDFRPPTLQNEICKVGEQIDN